MKLDKYPVQRYWKLKNTSILLAVSISLHAVTCLFTNNRFGLFFSLMSIYIQSQISLHSRDMKIKEYSNSRAFWDKYCHACSKLKDCACFFHSWLSLSKKSKSYVNLFKKHWWLQNSNLLMALGSISVTTMVIVLFFKKEN